jgi:hypothetical protein
MPQIGVGDVIKVRAFFVSPPKLKILICVCPIRIKYMTINSQPFWAALAAQMAVTKVELPFLDHDSHIDTAKLVSLSKMETQNAVDANTNCLLGNIPVQMRRAIAALVQEHGIMPKNQMEIVASNF